MEEKEIEDKIALRITEAKLDIAEKRLQHVIWYFGAVIAIFGVIVPLLIAYMTSNKIDNTIDKITSDVREKQSELLTEARLNYDNLRDEFKYTADRNDKQAEYSTQRINYALQDMHNQFKELAGNQLRKPELNFLVNGREIEDTSTLIQPFSFEIKNVGDGTAKNVQIRLYSTIENCWLNDNNANWNGYSRSDDQDYKSVYYLNDRPQLDPKESKFFEPSFSCEPPKQQIISCMIKIFYEQPEPKIYRFKLKITL